MTDLKVAIDALRYDAKVWDKAGDDLVDPTRAVGLLELKGAPDVMMFGADIGIDNTYNAARTAIEDLLTKAVGYFQELSNTLLAVAADYEYREAEAARESRELESELGDR